MRYHPHRDHGRSLGVLQTALYRVQVLTRALTTGALALTLLTLVTSAAAAQPKSGSLTRRTPPPAAVDHYERGREHYLAGRYREALTELKAALVLDPSSPNLLYNVARVNEGLGNLDEAIAYYERYLTVIPTSDTDERERTQATVRRLQGARDALPPPSPEAGEWRSFAPTVSRERPLGRADLWFWVAGGAGVALAAAGGIAGVVALQRQNDAGDFVIGDDGTLDQRRRLAKQADDFALASDLLFLGSAAALTGAALLFFLRDPEGFEDAPTATLHVSEHGAALAARFRL